jgi:hypothetical protein
MICLLSLHSIYAGSIGYEKPWTFHQVRLEEPSYAGPFGRVTSPGFDLPDSARSSLSIENRNMAIALLLDRRVEEGYTASMSIVCITILTIAPSPTGFCNSVIFHHIST